MMKYLLTPVGLLAAVALAACSAPTTTAAPIRQATGMPYRSGTSRPVADPLYPDYGNARLDALHYGLQLGWDPNSKILHGTATITLRAVSAIPEISLDLSAAMIVDRITLDGRPATGHVHGNKLTVTTKLSANQVVTAAVHYHGRPVPVPMPSHRSGAEPLGLSVGPGGVLSSMQEPYGAFTWYPVNDIPSDKALYDIAVTVPAGWAAVSIGTPEATQGTTFRYTTVDPVASYLTTLAVAKYHRETATGPHGLPLTYWSLPGTTTAQIKSMRGSPADLRWLEQKLGPYPFPTAGVAVVTGNLGMETQQMITLNASLLDPAADGTDEILIHEYAHHWFGDTVTPTTWPDLWLNEAFAQYFEDLHSNERTGTPLAIWADRLRFSEQQIRTQLGPPGKPKADDFADQNVYVCGELMLYAIQRKIGDTAFYSLARDWAQQHRDTNQDRASFTRFADGHSGHNLTPLINQWLDSPTTPTF